MNIYIERRPKVIHVMSDDAYTVGHFMTDFAKRNIDTLTKWRFFFHPQDHPMTAFAERDDEDRIYNVTCSEHVVSKLNPPKKCCHKCCCEK